MTIAALILAAGRASRFGADKRSALVDDGTPMLHAVFRQFDCLGQHVYAVLPADDPFGMAACREHAVTPIVHTLAQPGMGDSLALGVRMLAEQRDMDGLIVGLGDMPWVAPAVILSVAAALRSAQRPVLPVFQGRAGHPRGIPAACFAALAQAQGDEGARGLIDWDHALRLDVEHEGILWDVDTPADLETNRASAVPRGL